MAQGRNPKKLDLVRERGGVTACKGLTELVETADEVSSSKGQRNYQSGKEERGHKGETWVQRNELDPGDNKDVEKTRGEAGPRSSASSKRGWVQAEGRGGAKLVRKRAAATSGPEQQQ